jgi:uncharacterized membrane protein
MELLGMLHILQGEYGEYAHAGVAPVGLAALCAAVAGVAFSIARTDRRGRRSDVAVAAREILAIDLVRSTLIVLALQLATLCACENVEHLTAFGHASEGLEWLGGPVLAALAVHAAFALAITALVRRSLASILRTCDALVRAVFTLAVLIARPRVRAAFSLHLRAAVPALAAGVLACSRGLRAPPEISKPAFLH